MTSTPRALTMAFALVLGTALSASAQAKTDDAQIAAIAVDANQVDVDAGKLALSKAKNPEIKKFAQTMVTDHSGAIKSATDLVTKLKVTPKENETSMALTKDGQEERAKLSKLSGDAFDKAYIDNEVAYHKTVDSALQNTLIPSASNPQLKDLLTTGLKIFQGHEQHAEHVAAEFK